MNFTARWADIDMNGHMRHTAYNDYAAQARVTIFEEFDLGMDKLAQYRIGPVLFREETRFLKEVKLGQAFTVDTKIKSMTRNFRKWVIIHEMESNGEPIAVITVEGAWLGLDSRRVEIPPQVMQDIAAELPTTADFEWMD